MTVRINLKSHSAKSSLGQDGRINKTYTNTYLYRTSSGTPTDADITADIGIAPGSPYADDATATAGEANIEWLMSRAPFFRAEVTITWATNNPVPNTDSTDPATVRPLWDLQTTVQQRHITKDRLGEIIRHTNGFPPDGGIPVDVPIGQATVTVNVLDADFDYGAVQKHAGKRNKYTYLGAAPGTLQVYLKAKEKVEGAAHFWAVDYTFAYDPAGWQPKFASAGFYQLGALDVPVPITFGDLATPPTSDSTKVPEPEPLDSSGHVVPYADRPGLCAFQTVNAFDELDFTTLPGL